MKRIVGSCLVVLPLVACEPVDPGDQESTRFSDPAVDENGFDDSAFEQPADQPDWANDDAPPPPDDYYGGDVTTLTMREAHLRGSVGPVLDLQHEATDLYGSEMDGWLTVQTTVLEDPRIAMTIVDIMGDLSAFELGRTYRYGPDGTSADAPSAPWLSVIGCASADDPDEGFDYDQPAEDAAITVTEPETGVVEVAYDARFGQYDEYGQRTGDSVVHGRFQFER